MSLPYRFSRQRSPDSTINGALAGSEGLKAMSMSNSGVETVNGCGLQELRFQWVCDYCNVNERVDAF
jgi:hypothetical protein